MRHVVIVGGGSAGWLTAAVLAAEYASHRPDGLRVTLVESPEVATVGVGEGTWPSLRDTLYRIGVGESDFVRACDAAFKQGSRFVGWREDRADDHYHHPFVLPEGYFETSLVAGWRQHRPAAFAALTSVQPRLSAAGKGPKEFATPEYAGVVNYAYHLDAAKFGAFLREHCVARLGVVHVADHVDAIETHENGDIARLRTRAHGTLAGDLFVDCSGLRALLLGQHYGIALESCRDVLFNDRAIAVQLPYAAAQAPIACDTVATAQRSGWIWDIGLQHRRGVGHVYSSAHGDAAGAEQALRRYVAATGSDPDQVTQLHRVDFQPGYRRTAWHRNCVAIGLSSGFVEPLEASSLVMVELAAAMLRDQLPATRSAMDAAARRFNQSFAYRWERIVDFLKLHYVLSRRDDSNYWRDHRRADTRSARLSELLQRWRQRPPSRHDFPQIEEIFPSASYQYILYGMDFVPEPSPWPRCSDDVRRAEACFRQADARARQMLEALPGHRELLDHVRTRGLPRR
ncbi:tryptophan 7-halogenase [Xanthomonas sp. Kuri4-1]